MDENFDFGKNWKHYSENALDQKKFTDAAESLKTLFGEENFEGRRFLDIGCGSGIFSIAAKKMGARSVVGVDISQNSVEASQQNSKTFGLAPEDIHFFRMDILDRDKARELGSFERVYSWGVLHHTGKMWEAIAIACERVSPGGVFGLAIYDRHWTSPVWKKIKHFYNASPVFLKKTTVFFFFPVIFVAYLAIGKNPFRLHRGMDFYHDVVDWVGGYPYEYARAEEVIDFMKKKGLRLKSFLPNRYVVGNNQFIFVKDFPS